nr:amylo-alpha-1,6-glucosidase [uncultured Rhodopila sp.]
MQPTPFPPPKPAEVSACDPGSDAEWLEADGLGGFASGPVRGPRTRRYQALLLTATTPPTGRVVQVNGVEAEVETNNGIVALSTSLYLPDILHPDGWRWIVAFEHTPWPTWTFRISAGMTVRQEIFVARDTCETVLRWRLPAGSPSCRLRLRPLLSGRDYHALHRENAAFNFAALTQAGNVSWRPYGDLPAVAALTNGSYTHEPQWFRNVLYTAERERGLDHVEDLASPGIFSWDLHPGRDAVLILRAGDGLNLRPEAHACDLAEIERTRRARVAGDFGVAADSYLVDRGRARTLLAGFPWFTDWGRDTFIAMRGLMIARGRLAEAAEILDAWVATISEGMLPNRFLDDASTPEFNAVDSSLWFIIASHELLAAADRLHQPIDPHRAARLYDAFDTILAAYQQGTRYGIAADEDGLLRAGVAGVQLTWMDAKVGEWVVTPRIGKPVEVQALWINALRIAGARSARWAVLGECAGRTFAARFPDPKTGGLFDVVDADHVRGAVDARIRPNQIFAVGGLPFQVIDGEVATGVVRLVAERLLTPMGLRSLSANDPDYRPRYGGSPLQRDAAYHQGTVWPWLLGPFVEAWLRVSTDKREAAATAQAEFIAPLLAHLETAGLGHVSEIADGDPPHTPRGCPFQAWSMGELIRLQVILRSPEFTAEGDDR